MPGLLSGCAQRGQEAAPVAASPTQPDGYPNLNLPVRPAAPQLTNEERAGLAQELSAKRPQAGGADAPAATETESLRQLAQRQQDLLTELSSGRPQAGSGDAAEAAEAERLRRLAQQRQQEMLGQIERAQ